MDAHSTGQPEPEASERRMPPRVAARQEISAEKVEGHMQAGVGEYETGQTEHLTAERSSLLRQEPGGQAEREPRDRQDDDRAHAADTKPQSRASVAGRGILCRGS